MHRLRTLTRAALPALVLGWAAVAVLAVSAQTPEQRAALSANLFRPQQLPFEETLVERLSLPAGFRIGVFASGMARPA